MAASPAWSAAMVQVPALTKVSAPVGVTVHTPVVDDVKGLRTRIREQIKILEDAIAEKEFLEDYVSRRQAEAELFVKRRDAMADRLTELKKLFGIKDAPAPGS